MATSSLDRTIRLWDTRTGECIHVLMGGHRDWVRAVAYRPDGQQLASVGDDGAIRLWNPETGARLSKLPGHDGPALGLCWSPDNRLVISGGQDGWVCLWDASTLQRLVRLETAAGRISAVVVEPAGRWLALVGHGAVEVWDLASVRCMQRIAVQGDGADIAAGNNNQLFVVDSRGVQAWDVEQGRVLRMFDGHAGAVRAVSIHPNSLGLLTGGDDRAVRLWNAETAAEVWSLSVHGAPCTALAFHPAGHIGIGDADGRVHFQEMARGDVQ
jgi:WD40 repeat protein